MVCKKAPGKIARHQVLNDIIWRTFNAADVPAIKEQSGLNRQDGKRPDGLTLIPWQGGKPLIWDVTVASMLATSYTDIATTGAGLVADQSSTESRQSMLTSRPVTYVVQPIAVENLGPITSATLSFLGRISSVSGDDRATLFLFQRISVTIQRFNSVLLHDSFCVDCPDQ